MYVGGWMVQTAKNLVLAGMNVTLQDSAVLEVEDMSALYFATVEEVGQMVSEGGRAACYLAVPAALSIISTSTVCVLYNVNAAGGVCLCPLYLCNI
jgi:hypothetical protein